MQGLSDGARYAECVEALLEHDVSGDVCSVVREIPPVEMAHLLNTMLFTAPGEEVIDRVISAYFGGGGGMGDGAAEQCRIFLTGPDSSPNSGVHFSHAKSSSLDDDSYRNLEGRLIALVEVFSEKGEFGKALDIFNSLKTQSLQGKWRDHASAITRRIFSSEKVIAAIVGALRRYGRKRRDIASRLTSALRSFIIPYLLDALSEEEDTSIRRFLISLLTEVRSDAADHIAKRLRDSSWYVVRNMLLPVEEMPGQESFAGSEGFPGA